MPDRLTFVPMWDGSDLERAMLGEIEVGRVSSYDKRAGRGSWFCILPTETGHTGIYWRTERSPHFARLALAAHVEAWLHMAGLVTAEEHTRRGQVDLRQPLPAPPDFPDATGQQKG